MTHTVAPSRLPAWLFGSGVIAVAMGVMNLSTYGFTILAARVLGPSQYGALAALMGLMLVITVVSLGLQATGARRVSAAPDQLVSIESAILAVSYRSALALCGLTLLAVPVVTSLLRLDSWITAALLALTCLPLTVMGGQAGILQGERRWLPLAGIYLTSGVGRVIFGGIALLVQPTALSAMVGVALGAVVPVVIGWVALRHPTRPSNRKPRTARPARERLGWGKGSLMREMAHNSHALLAFFALSNADVVIARSMLPDHESGLYAGGLILAKAVLFLPQFVVVVAFPSMSADTTRRSAQLKGLALVLAIGASATLGAWLLSGLTVTFIGGSAYAEIQGVLWAFGAVGTLLAMNQFMVYGVVARQSQRAVFVLWAGLLTLLGFAAVVDSVTFLLTTVAAVQGVVLAALVVRGFRNRRPVTV